MITLASSYETESAINWLLLELILPDGTIQNA